MSKEIEKGSSQLQDQNQECLLTITTDQEKEQNLTFKKLETADV